MDSPLSVESLVNFDTQTLQFKANCPDRADPDGEPESPNWTKLTQVITSQGGGVFGDQRKTAGLIFMKRGGGAKRELTRNL